MNAARCGSLLLIVGSWACSIDNRELSLAGSMGQTAGSAGRPAGNGGSGARGSSEGGASGAPGPDGLVDGCADLDTDGVGDCTVTLVQTPTFTKDVRGWEAVGDAKLTWDAKNALSDAPSGSAKLSASSLRASAAQCLNLTGGKLVIAYANAFVDSVSEDERSAAAQLHVSFYEGTKCAGDPSGFFETPPSTEAGAWVTIQAGGLSDEKAGSLSIELVGVKPDGEAELDVYFDNVMVKAQEP
jgi:hypothetical protein